ncbi:MAG TPA: histidine phosphatase family protein [Propionicimonas sp.]|nr:histidine phosphatase family protein [Propionicimonas sp.]
MIDIYLCRHGRTSLNAAGRLRGRLDPELDLVGQAEAKGLAELLAKLQPTRIVSSPLQRATQTAAPIATAAGLNVELDGRLIDRAFGEADGEIAADVVRRFGSLGKVPGAEASDAVAARATAALNEIAEGSPVGPVIVITHDSVIRNFLKALKGTDAELFPQRTGSWDLLRYDDGDWSMDEFDSKDDPVETVLGN